MIFKDSGAKRNIFYRSILNSEKHWEAYFKDEKIKSYFDF